MGITADQVATMQPAQLGELIRADRLRWARVVRLAAWALGLLPVLVARGVAAGIALAFGDQPRTKPIAWDKLAPGAPDYDADDEDQG